MSTDAYYIQQLFDRISELKARLLSTQEGSSPLTNACDAILAAMQQSLSMYGDGRVSALFEVTVLPKIEHLLREAHEQLRLQRYTHNIVKHMQREGQRESKRAQLIAQQKTGAQVAPPSVNEFRHIPAPEYSPETRALIEDALIKLKAYLEV